MENNPEASADPPSRTIPVSTQLKTIAELFVVIIIAITVGSILDIAGRGLGQRLLNGGLSDIDGTVISVFAQGLGFIITGTMYLSHHSWSRDKLRIQQPSIKDGFWVLGAIVALFITITGLNYVAIEIIDVNEISQHDILTTAADQPQSLLLFALLSIVLIGPSEEYLFRGVIQTRFTDLYSAGVSITAASVLFTVLHIPVYVAGGGNWSVPVVTVFCLSIILGVAYEKTDNLIVPMIVHGLYNALSFLLLYWETSGGI